MNQARIAAAGMAVVIVAVSAGVAFAAVPGAPKFCNDRRPGRLEQPICDLFGKFNVLSAQVTELQNANKTQSDKIAALETRIKALEPTPTPTPSPAPSPSPTASPTPTPMPPHGPCGGGYPAIWCYAPQDSLVDSWGMYNRESTSYAAFRVASSGRRMPYWGGQGNPNQWPGNARAAGIPVDGTPRVGDIAIYMGGVYGHAMYVEAIVSSSAVKVSSYNADNTGHYSEDEWPTSSLYFIHF